MPETMPTVGVPALLLMLGVLLSILAAWIGVFLRLAFGLPVLPPRTPRYVPWGPGSVILAVLAWVALQIIVPIIYLIVTHPRPAGVAVGVRPELSPTEQMTLSALINACVLVVIPLALAVTSGARLRDFGIASKDFVQQFCRGVVAYPLLAPLVFGAMIIAVLIWNKTPHPLEDALKLDQSPGKTIILVLAGVVFAPLSEEMIFRGVLLGWLTRLVLGRPPAKPDPVDDFLGEPGLSNLAEPGLTGPGFADQLDHDPHNPYAPPTSKLVVTDPEPSSTATASKIYLLATANVVVSVIFAGLHAAVWPTPIPIFFLSLGLGLLYQRTGSLVPSVALHMTFNGVSTLMLLLTLGGGAAKKDDAKPAVAPKVEARPAAGILPVFSGLTVGFPHGSIGSRIS